jgi:hypothetical protein
MAQRQPLPEFLQSIFCEVMAFSVRHESIVLKPPKLSVGDRRCFPARFRSLTPCSIKLPGQE